MTYNNKDLEKVTTVTIAEAVRVEIDQKTDDVYLVFLITDENLKRRVKQDWTQDIQLKILGKHLVEE